MVTFLELLTVMNSIVIKLLVKTYKNIVIDGKIGLIYAMQYLHCLSKPVKVEPKNREVCPAAKNGLTYTSKKKT